MWRCCNLALVREGIHRMSHKLSYQLLWIMCWRLLILHLGFWLSILLCTALQSGFGLILLTIGGGNRRRLLSGRSIHSRRDLSLASWRVTWFRFGFFSVLVLTIALVVVGISLLYRLSWFWSSLDFVILNFCALIPDLWFSFLEYCLCLVSWWSWGALAGERGRRWNYFIEIRFRLFLSYRVRRFKRTW